MARGLRPVAFVPTGQTQEILGPNPRRQVLILSGTIVGPTFLYFGTSDDGQRAVQHFAGNPPLVLTERELGDAIAAAVLVNANPGDLISLCEVSGD